MDGLVACNSFTGSYNITNLAREELTFQNRRSPLGGGTESYGGTFLISLEMNQRNAE